MLPLGAHHGRHHLRLFLLFQRIENVVAFESKSIGHARRGHVLRGDNELDAGHGRGCVGRADGDYVGGHVERDYAEHVLDGCHGTMGIEGFGLDNIGVERFGRGDLHGLRFGYRGCI